MKPTLQKKLDDLGDRLKNTQLFNSTCKACGNNYDALKKRNNELLSILKELHNRYENALYNQPLWEAAKQLINNK